jgi:type II secretory pathway predicted ATPase ExeA
MEHLYQKHFGLSEAPFNITPDPSFLYLSASHQEGLAQLTYGITARRGFIVLTGEVGTGKTTLIQTLLRQLPATTHTALIFSAITGPVDLFRYICEEFGLVESTQQPKEAHDYINLLNGFLLQKYREGDNAALIIDEAQNLSSDVLESIRLLSNFETTKDKLLQILLIGQPELTDRLNTLQLRQLKQRVTLRHHLRPFSLAECQEYIASRLKQAGGYPKIFSSKAIEEIYRYSGGIPRLINVICDNAMISAYALDRKEIVPSLIREVADDLHLIVGMTRPAPIKKETPLGLEGRAPVRSEPPKPYPMQLIKNPRFMSSSAHLSAVSTDAVMPTAFFVELRDALVDAMGPMAQIVLSEHVSAMGATAERFPREKMDILIDSVSREIFDISVRERFRRNMFQRLGDLRN